MYIRANFYLEARRVFAVGLEQCAQVPSLELAGEALVGCPEQADVINAKPDHGQALQAQAKCPGFVILPAIVVQYLLLHNPMHSPHLTMSGCTSVA